MRKIFRLVRASLRGDEYDYTSGSIKKAIFMLSIPMVLEMAMESLFALVDAFFVAQVSPDAVATVGLTESVITLVYAVAIGISTAPVAMIARYIGEKDQANASRVAKQAIYMAIGVFYYHLFIFCIEGIGGFIKEEVVQFFEAFQAQFGILGRTGKAHEALERYIELPHYVLNRQHFTQTQSSFNNGLRRKEED
eukprot:g691.t1